MRETLKELEVGWLYCSFVGKGGFLGACYVPQKFGESKLKYPAFGVEGIPKEEIIEIMIVIVPSSQVPKDHKYHNRLLTKREVEESTGQQALRYSSVPEGGL